MPEFLTDKIKIRWNGGGDRLWAQNTHICATRLFQSNSQPSTWAPKPVLLTELNQMNLMRPYKVKSPHSRRVSSSEWGNAEVTGIAFQTAPRSPGKWAWKWHISIWASFSVSKCKVISLGGNNPNYKIMGSELSLTVWKPMSALVTKGNGWKWYPRQEMSENASLLHAVLCIHIWACCSPLSWEHMKLNLLQLHPSPR